MSSTFEILQSVLRDLSQQEKVPAQLATVELDPQLALRDLDIDSLGMSMLTLELEDRTDVRLPDDAAIRFENVADLVAYIDEARGNLEE